MNTTQTLMHTVRALAISFLTAFLSLALFCLVAWLGDDPMKMLPLFASLSLVLAGVAAGFFGGRGEDSPLGSGMLTGTIAMILVFGISFFFGKAEGSTLRSILSAVGMLLSSFVGAWISRRPGRSRPTSPAKMHKRAVAKMRKY